MYNPDDEKSVEKYSAAVTLSDMEIFIFPELLIALAIANAMSPRLWRWADDPWFKKKDMAKLSPYRRILRVKQYIMDNFIFNLDLYTWGLTTKEKELRRFSNFIDDDILKKSNALFGYEGDKYYFDMDIRKHFGLDKYNSDVIPYWKTETLEAMDAFRFKEGYSVGAGECVSLSALYASALFVVGKIPFENIYMMATPLHSQNFIDLSPGIVTNNRRIVTKTMWFNGSEFSTLSRRALENERVTIVAHISGVNHIINEEATIDCDAYDKFQRKLKKFLLTEINFEIFANFLRQQQDLQKYFQLAHERSGQTRYIEAEKVYGHEPKSKFSLGGNTQVYLLNEIDKKEYHNHLLSNRILLDDIKFFLENTKIFKNDSDRFKEFKRYFGENNLDADSLMEALKRFCKTIPRLPGKNKKWISSKPIRMDRFSSKNEILEYMYSIKNENETADLAFMAYRDMEKSPWKPFFKAAIERNPVCIEGSRDLDTSQLFTKLSNMKNISIYDGTRVAQPDEIWNFERGDGLEKAICLMSILKSKYPEENVFLESDGKTVTVGREKGKNFQFISQKKLKLRKESQKLS